ncbi:hypothetical protein ATCV1_z112R [Acanthocystis turfacea chlorella virus 1]|uniref:Uncharacterized protein z112R n=1 Tax=Chlorovirus heliozoae TaxID=322019 RepID=A7K872_9PHYC|nr:hypothetical protein ATCV1_z112R [Acanthocystis turfacea chlorella virus 1]ABT16246.1 hypothetical protein ATCV1_z112R [Acanthocystis turfacea chlorella virus 1]
MFCVVRLDVLLSGCSWTTSIRSAYWPPVAPGGPVKYAASYCSRMVDSGTYSGLDSPDGWTTPVDPAGPTKYVLMRPRWESSVYDPWLAFVT